MLVFFEFELGICRTMSNVNMEVGKLHYYILLNSKGRFSTETFLIKQIQVSSYFLQESGI